MKFHFKILNQIVIDFIDTLLLVLVLVTLMDNFLFLIEIIYNNILNCLNIKPCSLIIFMDCKSNNNTQIIQQSNGWSETVRTILIYGTGTFRYTLLRNGATPKNEGNTSITNSVLFLIKSKFGNYIPSYLKYCFTLILLKIIVIKILGYNFIGLIQNIDQLIHLYSVLVFMVIIWYISNLVYIYILYKYEKMVYPEILPNVILDFFKKENKLFYRNEGLFNALKKEIYIQLIIYSTILILVKIFI